MSELEKVLPIKNKGVLMAATRDLDTEALGWAILSLGVQSRELAPAALEELPPVARYVAPAGSGTLGALVDLSNPTAPSLLLTRPNLLRSALEAFAAGERTPRPLLEELRAYHRGLSKTFPPALI